MTDDHLIASARTAVRLLEENRIRLTRHERETRLAAISAGRDIDTRVDYAKGSADAYAISVSTILGAFGYATVADMLGAPVTERVPLPPMLPDQDAVTFAPGDTIAAATVVHDRQTKTDR